MNFFRKNLVKVFLVKCKFEKVLIIRINKFSTLKCFYNNYIMKFSQTIFFNFQQKSKQNEQKCILTKSKKYYK